MGMLIEILLHPDIHIYIYHTVSVVFKQAFATLPVSVNIYKRSVWVMSYLIFMCLYWYVGRYLIFFFCLLV